MTNFKTISKIFSDFTGDNTGEGYADNLSHLVWLNIKTNKTLWNLEDSARLSELGDKHVADTKREIDKNNKIRNDLIKEIDTEIAVQMGISSDSQGQFYSESPGMIVDRLAIIFLKLSVIRKLLSAITENDLKKDYNEKEKIVTKQFDRLGTFLDSYFSKLANKEVLFEVQQPVKIYNDVRVKKYITSCIRL